MKDSAPFRPSDIAHWLAGVAILFGCELLGRWIGQGLALPVPGSVIGMLLLLIGLMFYGSVPRGLARVSEQLLRLLALLFLPAAVGVFFLHDLDPADWLGLLAATTLGTLLTLVLSALLLKKLLGPGDGHGGDSDG